MANKEHRVKQSLGLLEVCGLALAISCADIMAKSASITLVALEKTNGSGWTVIKLPVMWPPCRRPSPPVHSLPSSETAWWPTKSSPGPEKGSCARRLPRPPSCNLSLKRQGRLMSFRQRQQKSFPSNTAWFSCNLCLDRNVRARRASRARFAFTPASEVRRNG
ncbi:propanediol utilization polyhedral body protein PduK [Klebsiella michiganensis]|nr:propanediol utilization polyhedral body protein PduK [Klebsiella michiganensis]